MKIKSFTLVEVMVASYIFMIVIVMVTSSFAMIRKSNENSDDTRVTSNCSRQVEDVFKSAVKSASFGNPVMKAIVYSGTEYKLYDSSSVAGTAVGFATFEDPGTADISAVRIKTFVKKLDTVSTPSTYSYYYAVGDISLKTVTGIPSSDPRKNIADGISVTSIVNGASVVSGTSVQRINSADCSAGDGTIYIQRVSASGARSSVYVYSLEVRDKFFRAFANRATETQYSDLNLFVSNDAKNF